jgi:hypothetical protein
MNDSALAPRPPSATGRVIVLTAIAFQVVMTPGSSAGVGCAPATGVEISATSTTARSGLRILSRTLVLFKTVLLWASAHLHAAVWSLVP